jgi:Tol biopolymer transport system component/DNA-binding winged helix-turn-helix (wHTH) protein
MISKRELQQAEPGAQKRTFAFAGFVFDAEDKILWHAGEPVGLPPKTCELLAVFIENAGQILTKEDLMSTVWADTFVEEANLSHHIAVLRKSLGETKNGGKFIQTIPRKGYRFVAPVSLSPPQDTLEITVSERTTTQFIEEIENGESLAPSSKPPLPVSLNRRLKAAGQPPNRAPIYFSIALLLIAGLAFFVWFKSASTNSTEQIQNPKSQNPNPLTVTRVTNSGKVGASSISPDGKFVAYAQNHTDGVGTLYIRQTDTNFERRLVTHERGEFGTTAFSPDGMFVFYAVRDATHPNYGVYRVPVIGGAPVRLVENPREAYFAISPDGSQAAIIRDDPEQKQSSLVAVSLDGSGAEQILVTRSLREMQLLPGGTWSPDGQQFVLPVRTAAATNNYSQSVTNVMLCDVATGQLRNFTEETWLGFGIMRWMPDASGVVVIGTRPRVRNQIYFISNPSGEVSRLVNDANGYGNYGLGITADGSTMVVDVWEFQGRIWTMDASGDMKTAVRLPAGDTTISAGLTTLPDGRILYSTRTDSNFDLWTLGESDAEAKPLTSDAFYDDGAVASPDGSFIVFASDRAGAGTSHLFRINADGSRIAQLTFGESFEYSPDISPDGNWIIYHSRGYDQTLADWTNTIRKIPNAGGAPVQLFEGGLAPAFSPDGESFSCIVPEDNYRGKIAVISARGGSDAAEPIKAFDVNYHFHHQLPARWTPDGTALVFRNTENQVTNLWKQNLAGGAAVRLTDFKSEVIFNFVFSRDGKRLLLSRGSTTVNVVMLKNFR